MKLKKLDDDNILIEDTECMAPGCSRVGAKGVTLTIARDAGVLHNVRYKLCPPCNQDHRARHAAATAIRRAMNDRYVKQDLPLKPPASP